MSNAVKFSPEGSVIDISMKEEGGFAKVSVRDHGVGIASDRLGNIFHKGESTYGTSGEEGSGLGLQLCADFAHKIGGDVHVESVLNEGSTFSVFIPLKKD
jgi:two-component system sensor histidine kinase/response regulator